MKNYSNKKAFTLLELSVVVIVIAFLIAGIFSGKRIIEQSNLQAAQALTKSASIISIPDLALWLETSLDESLTGVSGNRGSGISGGESITSWNDISGNGFRLIQSTAINRPTYLIKGINNIPSVKFNSANNNVLYSATAPIPPGSSKYTMIAVWKSNSLPNCILVEQKLLASANNRNAGIWLNSASLEMTGYSNDTGTIATLATNGIYIFFTVLDNVQSSNFSGYVKSNTVVQGSNTTPGSLNLGSDVFSVGARVEVTLLPLPLLDLYTPSMPCDADVSEVIIFNRNINPTEVQIINRYLSKKYNITVS